MNTEEFNFDYLDTLNGNGKLHGKDSGKNFKNVWKKVMKYILSHSE